MSDVIKLVTSTEREDAAIAEARDAAHEEAKEQLAIATRLVGERRCRGVVIAAIIEEPNGQTAMFTSVPLRLDGAHVTAVVGAVHHAAWRLHELIADVGELPMPDGVRE